MLRKTQTFLVVFLMLFLAPTGLATAQYTSPNYKAEETFFGIGGELETISPNYQAKVALGELGIDHAEATNFQTYSGFNTTDRPILEVAVTGGTYDLGILNTTTASAITTVFTVRNYLSSGYSVRIGGGPPKNNGTSYTLNNLTSPTTSSPGSEQFGINLAANNLTGPGAFGAVPSQIPDVTFGFGAAASDYATSNQFKYVENDTIAGSNKSSGTTQYTLSAIANISGTTPAGNYGTSLFINVIPTF